MSEVYDKTPLKNHHFKRVRPTSDSTKSSFNGTVDLTWTIGMNAIWNRSESSIHSRFKITTYNGAGAIIASQFSLSNDPLSTTFSSSELSLNSTTVSTSSVYPQTAFVSKMLFNSPQRLQNNQSTSPISLRRRWGTTALITAPADRGNAMRDSLAMHVADASQEFVMTSDFPLLMTQRGQTDDLFPGNTSWSLKMVVDSNWKTQILANGGPALFLVAGDDHSVPVGAGDANRVRISLEDIYLNIAVYESASVPRSMSSMHNYWETSSMTRSVSGHTETVLLTLPKGCEMLAFGFVSANRETEIGADSNDFLPDDIRSLRSTRLVFGGQTYPQETQDMYLGAGTPGQPQLDTARVFADYVQSTHDLSPNGSSFDYNTWRSQPLFFHRIARIPGDAANTAELHLTHVGGGVPTTLVAVAYYRKSLEIQYNEFGLVNEVGVGDVV